MIVVIRNLIIFASHAYQAGNTAGWSLSSEITSITSPPSCPAPLTLRKTAASPTSLSLAWSEPADHGSPVLHYVLETSDPAQSSITCETTSHVLTNLCPHTTYR